MPRVTTARQPVPQYELGDRTEEGSPPRRPPGSNGEWPIPPNQPPQREAPPRAPSKHDDPPIPRPTPVEPPRLQPPANEIVPRNVDPYAEPIGRIFDILGRHDELFKTIVNRLDVVIKPPPPPPPEISATGIVVAVSSHLLAIVAAIAGLHELLVASRQTPTTKTAKPASADGTGGETVAPPPSKLDVEVEVKVQGIAIKTSRISGLLLLVAALAFYFLYIRFVAPITLSSEEPAATAQARAQVGGGSQR